MTTNHSPDALRRLVTEGYDAVARGGGSCGCSGGCAPLVDSRTLGYADADLAAVPSGADQGLGCGAPVDAAAVRPGETVLDLGSGPGLDSLLAARAVGPTGRVIGVDMTPSMIKKARGNAAAAGAANVEYRQGLIEELPVESGSVDVILSNCVINLSPEKERVFAEAWRVLRPGGRLVVSDIVLDAPLPAALAGNLDALIGCVANAALRDDYLAAARAAGFAEVEILRDASYGTALGPDTPFIAQAAADLALSPSEVTIALSSIRSLTLRAWREGGKI